MNGKILAIIFLIFAISVYAQNDIKIISSNRNFIVVAYTPTYTDSSIQKINQEKFINLKLWLGEVSAPEKWGVPAIPQRVVNIGVPQKTGNSIQILNTAYKEIHGKIIPKPEMVKEGNTSAFVYKVGEDYYSQNNKSPLVTFGEFGISRGIKTQSIILSPVEFNSNSNIIKLYTKIVFKIIYSSQQRESRKPAGNFMKGALLNFSVAKYWVEGNRFHGLKKVVSNSVLATGKWIKFETPQEGIYKITRSMLPSFGIDPNTVNPKTIKIYNNGGKMLPENPMAPRPNDLVQNAIIVVGENDGKFNNNDYILFYGRDTDFWAYDSSSKTVKRYHNIYSNHNYYWITSGGVAGKRMIEENSLKVSNPYVQTSSKAYAFWEKDKINIGKTGKLFVGDDFSPSFTSRTYITELAGRISSEPVNYFFRFVNASPGTIGLEVDENSTTIFNQTLYGYGRQNYVAGIMYSRNISYSGNLPDNRSVLKFSITPSSVASIGYIDYFNISYTRTLNAVNDNLSFFSADTSDIIQYDLSGFSSSNIQVFNVTDYANVKLINNPVMLSGGEYRFQAVERDGHESKYIAVGNGNYKTPVNPVEVGNSNLHGIKTGAKFIIITPKEFEDAAKKLQYYHENQAKVKISTIVVDVDQIFNEFGGGIHDVSAIRDFIKYAYDNWTIKPQYVLLFGKGSYDYKDIGGTHNNFIPAYESTQSLNLIGSYTTDDYFVRVDGNDNLVDLAIGRLTVETPAQANDAVDKIIRYGNDSNKGPWRNLITLVADDGYTSKGWEGNYHTPASEYLANHIIPNSFDLNKVYLAAYPVVYTGFGRTIPDANKAIINSINDGTLIVNYVGHGNPEVWAHEVVFDKSVTIPQLHNTDYFFLTAATCDFGYFDIPNFQSAAEALVLKNNGGAIAAFTASRLVYSTPNHELMYDFFRNLLDTSKDSLDLPITIGKALFLTKQVYNSINSQKYGILGDPTLRLVMPEYSASIDSIDGKLLINNVQIKALSNTSIQGEVRKPNNSLWSNFNGQGILTVFDSKRRVKLPALRNNYAITVQGGVLFRGRISITDGEFSANFVVPKDISYENKNGKIILYFFNDKVDGLGYTNKVIIGGTDTTTVNDGKGPKMEIYFDNTAFNNGYLVNPNSTLIVDLSDQTGINTTGTGVGHKLEGILNNDENNPIDFTNYFTGDLNSGGKSGEIKYPLHNLAIGNYTIKVKAWDVFNNFSSVTANFKVVNGNGLEVQDVYNYPNPFNSSTTFTFQQNLNSPLNVKIKIYTVAGRLIKEIERGGILNKFVKIYWNGRDEDGDPLANGAYLYKLIVKTMNGKFTKSVLGKLAIIR
mgnify:CR=1 FL=1